MMRVPSPGWWAVLTFAGLFNDERICVALPLAVAVAFYEHRADVPRALRRALPCMVGATTGIVAAVAVRYGIRTGLVGGAPLIGADLPHSGGRFPWDRWHTVSLFTSYAFMWALPGIAIVYDRQARFFWGLVATYTAVAVFITTYAFDFWRGLGALFPGFVLAFLVLAKLPFRPLRSITLWMMVLMLLRPQLFATGSIKLLRPLPVALYELWSGKSILAEIKANVWPTHR